MKKNEAVLLKKTTSFGVRVKKIVRKRARQSIHFLTMNIFILCPDGYVNGFGKNKIYVDIFIDIHG